MNDRSRSAAHMLRTSAAGVSLVLGLLATPATAQGAGAETDDSTIIVTATRRSEALSDVPIAVSALINPASATCSNLPAASFPGFQGIVALLGAAPLISTGNNGSTFHQRGTNYALFTHNSFDIIEDALTLTVGARYTHEKKTLAGDANFTNTLCPAPEWLVYASVSKGYKEGGFNLDYSALDRPCSTTAGSAAQNAACTSALARPANTPGNGRPETSDLQFASEKVDAYELGVKWDGPGIDVNRAAFWQEYSNYQLNTFNGVNFAVTNIQACKDDLAGADIDASATTGACVSDRLKPGVVAKGFEIETFLRPARDISVNMGLSPLPLAGGERKCPQLVDCRYSS